MMEEINHSQMYKIISYLLQYPNEEMKKAFPSLLETVEEMNHPQVTDHIERFLTIIEDTDFDAWEQHYIDFFDFGKKTNLYVTYYEFGEERERGLQLLKIKGIYEEAGFAVAENELSDFLPLMLEFSGHAEEKDRAKLLQSNVKAIKGIREGLVKEGSFYTLLFDALFIVLELEKIYEEVI